ncbi:MULTISPECIES: copper homeostasis protein CutC [unclassified Frigoribacterium]|uniref:copper homeostasis protein CutC n=1 Tax=unclassified Frigoribacterium TaxID=2627005 RepID=UPI0015642A1B|nr:MULTISPECIES: copper homeostasis protein CutC [unclassified Frigoribacterium]NQW88021.1 copper homeostasis protein CutC [Frigoribacterium sp. VKM Ac-2860]NQX09170.1 copper homeostasis protein CutC [Frigoribacterium sp. VKM Ac-2859]
MTNDATRASSSADTSARRRPALEIAVTSAAGAVTARDGGADRVELCSALELGGVTPSQGLVEAAVATGVPVHALVRCRPGGFAYDADELDVMVREIRALVRSGVAGVVVGALREDGSLDVDALRWFVEAALDAAAPRHRVAGPQDVAEVPPRGVGSTRAPGVSPLEPRTLESRPLESRPLEPRPLEITVHRAVDRAADPVAAVTALAGLGVTRVLTSGGSSTVGAGLASGVLPRLVEVAGDVQVMAGGGVQLGDVPALVAAGVDAVHLSAKRARAVRASSSRSGTTVSLGTEASTDSWFETDHDLVRAARHALDQA